VFRLTHETWFDVLGGRPTDALWGIGAKTARKLAALGIETVRDLARADPEALTAEFGPATGPWLVRLARGQDHSPVSSAPYLPRSRGREVTFQANLDDWEQVRAEVVRLAERVTADVVAEGRPAVRVVVKVRYAPFFTSSHSRSLPGPTADGDAIREAEIGGLERGADGRADRLVGVRAEFADGADRCWPPAADRRRWPGPRARAYRVSALPAARAARMICVTSPLAELAAIVRPQAPLVVQDRHSGGARGARSRGLGRPGRA
jgi:nucleotidyltransferase/DNA polymerase involved in DNA repair